MPTSAPARTSASCATTAGSPRSPTGRELPPAVLERPAEQGPFAPGPPLTGVGAAALAKPGLLVEVEATAVLD